MKKFWRKAKSFMFKHQLATIGVVGLLLLMAFLINRNIQQEKFIAEKNKSSILMTVSKFEEVENTTFRGEDIVIYSSLGDVGDAYDDLNTIEDVQAYLKRNDETLEVTYFRLNGSQGPLYNSLAGVQYTTDLENALATRAGEAYQKKLAALDNDDTSKKWTMKGLRVQLVPFLAGLSTDMSVQVRDSSLKLYDVELVDENNKTHNTYLYSIPLKDGQIKPSASFQLDPEDNGKETAFYKARNLVSLDSDDLDNLNATKPLDRWISNNTILLFMHYRFYYSDTSSDTSDEDTYDNSRYTRLYPTTSEEVTISTLYNNTFEEKDRSIQETLIIRVGDSTSDKHKDIRVEWTGEEGDPTNAEKLNILRQLYIGSDAS